MRKQVLVIQVMDTGKGMDVDSQSRYFFSFSIDYFDRMINLMLLLGENLEEQVLD